MLNLIRLELKKLNLKSTFKGVAITNIVLILLGVFIGIVSKIEGEMDIRNFYDYFQLTELMVRVTFIIFGAVFLSKLTVSEYKNKTINIMFMYPINRKSLFIAKAIVVVVFTFINILLSNILLIIFSLGADIFINTIPGSLSINEFFSSYTRIIINAVFTSFSVLIPLYFGMRKKSVSATIISAVILASLVSNGNGEFSLGSFLPTAILIGLAGVVVSMVTLKNIEKADVL